MQKLPYFENPDFQESYLIGELLNAMVGIEGDIINLKKSPAQQDLKNKFERIQGSNFDIVLPPSSNTNPTNVVDSSAIDLLKKCLNVCNLYIRVQAYIEEYSQFHYGRVQHMFCVGLKNLVKQYLNLVEKLESQKNSSNSSKLTLTFIFYAIQKTMKSFTIVNDLLQKTFKTHGGSLINVLYNLYLSYGNKDTHTQKLFQYLLFMASKPFFVQLKNWITKGNCDDPFNEFMILQKNDVALYDHLEMWEKRFTLRKGEYPSFLERISEKILLTGKFLNVLENEKQKKKIPSSNAIKNQESEEKEENGVLEISEKDPFLYDQFSDEDYFEKVIEKKIYEETVQKCYIFASQTLLDMILGKYRFVEILNSLKHFYLLDRGDFFEHFIDMSEKLLSKEADSVSLNQLKSFLDISVKTSSLKNDPFSNRVGLDLSKLTLPQFLKYLEQFKQENATMVSANEFEEVTKANFLAKPKTKPTVLESLVITFDVPWPLSIILHQKNICKYQIIFRHIFNLKYVEKKLLEAWASQKFFKELNVNFQETPIMKLFAIRQKLLHFFQSFMYFISVEVFEKNFHEMTKKVAKRESLTSIQDLIDIHDNFLDQVLKNSLLTDNALFTPLTKLVNLAKTFSKFVQKFTDTLTISNSSPSSTAQGKEKTLKDTSKTRQARIETLSEHIMKSYVKNQSYGKTLDLFHTTFEQALKEFLSELKRKQFDLYCSLSFNHFYQ